MDKKFLIQQEAIAKYRITITCKDFDQTENDFYVLLVFGATDETIMITKSEMMANEENRYYFSFKTDGITGMICAECHYFIPDSDYESGIREAVDYQFIGFVTNDPCPKFPKKCECMCNIPEDNPVQYKRMYSSDLHTVYLKVRTCDKQPVRTVNSEQVRVHKSEEDI